MIVLRFARVSLHWILPALRVGLSLGGLSCAISNARDSLDSVGHPHCLPSCRAAQRLSAAFTASTLTVTQTTIGARVSASSPDDPMPNVLAARIVRDPLQPAPLSVRGALR